MSAIRNEKETKKTGENDENIGEKETTKLREKMMKSGEPSDKNAIRAEKRKRRTDGPIEIDGTLPSAFLLSLLSTMITPIRERRNRERGAEKKE